MDNELKIGDLVQIDYFVDDEAPAHKCHGKVGRVKYLPERHNLRGLMLYGIDVDGITWNFSAQWLRKVK